jgi:hypothetical protein
MSSASSEALATALIRVWFSQVSKGGSETMPRNHRKPFRNRGETVSELLLIYQLVNTISARNRNHGRHSTETTETMSIHMVSWFRTSQIRIPFGAEEKNYGQEQ